MANRDFAALTRQWAELEAAGIPLEPLENRVGIDKRNSGTALTIRAGRDRLRSEIRELKGGRFGYILPLFVRRNLPGKTIIRDSWIVPPWLDTNIEWLEDPRDEGKHPAWYSFPGDSERFFRERVLNHRINCVLSHGDIREGLLLGVGLRPPQTYENHQKIEVTFGILDQWDCEPSVKLQMQISRLPTRAKMINKRTRGPLLSRRDFVAPARSLTPPSGPTEESRKKDEEAIRRMDEEMARITSERKNAKMTTSKAKGPLAAARAVGAESRAACYYEQFATQPDCLQMNPKRRITRRAWCGDW
jgi:hypothetical protein